MAFLTPVNRTQIWMARGAILVLAGLFLFLKVFGLGDVTGAKGGNSIVYTAPPIGFVVTGMMGILVGVAAAVYWMQRRRSSALSA